VDCRDHRLVHRFDLLVDRGVERGLVQAVGVEVRQLGACAEGLAGADQHRRAHGGVARCLFQAGRQRDAQRLGQHIDGGMVQRQHGHLAAAGV